MKQKEFYSQYTAEQIENTLVRSNEKPFVIYQDVDNECYRFFVDQEKADAWIAEYQAAMDEGR